MDLHTNNLPSFYTPTLTSEPNAIGCSLHGFARTNRLFLLTNTGNYGTTVLLQYQVYSKCTNATAPPL